MRQLLEKFQTVPERSAYVIGLKEGMRQSAFKLDGIWYVRGGGVQLNSALRHVDKNVADAPVT